MMAPIDIEAGDRALAILRTRSAYAERVERWIAEDGLDDARANAAFVLQTDALKLRPWQCPPATTHGDSARPCEMWGNRSNEMALRDRMLAAGLSVLEPDPLGALAKIEKRCSPSCP